MRATRWAAAVLVVVGVAFAGQALAGTDLRQTFKAAKQNVENLVEVLRLALQSGANVTEVAAAASDVGIAADIVTAAALAAGQQPPTVARAIESSPDANLGYLEPAASKPLSVNDAASGTTEVAGTRFDISRNAVSCPPGLVRTISSVKTCCCQGGRALEVCTGVAMEQCPPGLQ